MSRAAVTVLLLSSALHATAGCTELIRAATSSDDDANLQDDNYKEEPAASEEPEFTACGRQWHYLRAVQVGSDRWGPFELAGADRAQRIECEALSEKDEYDESFADAVEEIRKKNKTDGKGVITWDGKFEVQRLEENGFERLYKTAKLVYDSRETTFRNRCGEDEPDLTCENHGLNGVAVHQHNRVFHLLQRADLHRGAGNAQQCKELLKQASGWHDSFTKDYKRVKEENDPFWIAGMTYRIRSGEKLSEKKFVARIKAGGKQAKKRLNSSWCEED